MHPELYNNQYKRGTRRSADWHYGWEAAYFITICTQEKKHFFGKVSNGEMILNECGQIAFNEWAKTEQIRKDMNVELFDFVIMPNHMHAIIKIGWNQFNTQVIDPNSLMDSNELNGPGSCAMHRAATWMDCDIEQSNEDKDDIFSNDHTIYSLEEIVELKKRSNNKFGPQSKNLGSIIRGYKSAVTTQIRISGNADFAWQSRFHEHIVSSERAFSNIQKYIRNNPAKWKK